MSFGLWLHQLFHVHCEQCKLDELQARECDSCDNLKIQLEAERQENERLLNHIITLTGKPVNEQSSPAQPQIPIGKTLSWRTQKALLEERDRETARLIRDSQRQDKEIANLEKEVGISGDIKENNQNDETVGGST